MTEYNKTIYEVWEQVGTHLSDAIGQEGFHKGTSRSDLTNAIVDIPSMVEPKNLLAHLKPRDWLIIGTALAVATTTAYFVGKKFGETKTQEGAAIKRLEDYQSRSLSDLEKTEIETPPTQDLISADGPKLSEEQWLLALTKLLEIDLFREKLRQLLVKAQITDATQTTIDWQKQLQGVSAEELAKRIRSVIEENPELLDSDEFEAMLRFVLRNDEGPDELGTRV